MNHSSKIYITGHRGMLGSTTLKVFKDAGYTNIITATHAELDLTNQAAVEIFFEQEAIYSYPNLPENIQFFLI